MRSTNTRSLRSIGLLLPFAAVVMGGLLAPSASSSSLQIIPGDEEVSVVLGGARAIPVEYVGPQDLWQTMERNEARPTAMAAGDFDEDGVPDLFCAYAGPFANFVALHRGNVDAIHPHSMQAQQRRQAGIFTDEPFFPSARLTEVPVPPDFLAAGDFDNDGHWDLAMAAEDGTGLYLLTGDGRGGLRPAERVTLPGAVTVIAAGEVNRADGLVDLIVGVVRPEGAAALVFEGPEGALKHAPEVIPLPSRPRSLLMDRISGSPWFDLAVGAGDELVIVHGRDRKLILGEKRRREVGPPIVQRIALPATVEAVTWGDFVRESERASELAVLLGDGSLHIMQPTDPPGEQAREDRSWETVVRLDVSTPWPDRTVPTRSRPVLLATRMSDSGTEDLVLLDGSEGRLRVLAGMVSGDPTQRGDYEADGFLSHPGRRVSVDPEQAWGAVLPMRLNADALTDLVMLQAGTGVPYTAPTAPAATITVNSSLDNTVAGDGQCTLREAITNASDDTDTTSGDCPAGAGADLIAFNISGGGSPATIVLQSTYLPHNYGPVTIDGTTQGCPTPPCIVLDGDLLGGITYGLLIYGGSSSVRGFTIHRFSRHGILVDSSGNFIEGNYLGTDLTGTLDMGNGRTGINIFGDNNVVGGTTAAARNVLSGNGYEGVFILWGGSNQVLGNYIGTDVSGMLPLGNTRPGITIQNGATNNVVGGTVPGSRNIISGGNGGVLLFDGVSGNLLQGNYIGTDVTGASGLGNVNYGAQIETSSGNTIGGTAPGAGNVISGNTVRGILVQNASQNSILGNYIGTDAGGTLALGNGADGIHIQVGVNNTVGGTVADARNVISGNGDDGIEIRAGSQTNSLLGNYIGIDASGAVALGNHGHGVHIHNSMLNLIGDELVGAGNVISGNDSDGIFVEESPSLNWIEGNLIGIDFSGTVGLGNGGVGVRMFNASNVTVGGFNSGAGNIISANGASGVLIAGTGGAHTVQGNYIGTDIAGVTALGNGTHGVDLAASNNTVGGTLPGSGNVVSGNTLDGIFIHDAADGNSVLGNLIGTDASGAFGVGNESHGVSVGAATNTVIGGSTTEESNVISDNGTSGVSLSGTTGSTIVGNIIGFAADGVAPLGNVGHGISMANDTSGNTIGGAGVTAGRCDGPCNLIGHSQSEGADGVHINEGNNASNAIMGNCIHSNAGLGIDLGPDGVTSNDEGDGDSGANGLQNFPLLIQAEATGAGVTVGGTLNSTPSRGFRLEYFASRDCDSTGNGEGARYLGFTEVTTGLDGNAAFSVPLTGPVTDGDAVTATATNLTTNDTSEHSGCIGATCLEMVTFVHKVTAPDKSTLSWRRQADVHYVRGPLATVSSYEVVEAGDLLGATSLDMSSHDGSFYYLVRPLGCGSWQNELGAEPGRDAALP